MDSAHTVQTAVLSVLMNVWLFEQSDWMFCWLSEWLTDWLIVLLQVCSESLRFEKLMEHFKNEDDNIDFLVQ